MKKNKNHAFKTYDKIASWYDQNRSRELFEKNWLDQAIALLPENPKVLDLGCGTGTPMIDYFLEKGCQVTGIDGSENQIAIAKTRYHNVTFIVSDMRNLNLDQKFDLIIAWHSFFHLPQHDQQTMFPKFSSHLKPSGILLFTSGPEAGEIWSENGGEALYHASLSPNEYKDLLQKHGFTLINHRILDPECGDATVWLAKLLPIPIENP